VRALGLGLGDSYIQIIVINGDSNINLTLFPHQLLPISELLPYGDSMAPWLHGGAPAPWRQYYPMVLWRICPMATRMLHSNASPAVTMGDTY